MKLIECYIENFGKLSAYSYTFSDGLNVIKGYNGFGKTTLSVFIKSMLFGIDTKKTKGEESDRKRYMPWQGGRFGGSLTFENLGKRYRIERTFGSKASGDVFAIFDTESGSPSHDFTEKVGEELFGIDAEGFEMTVFLSEKKLTLNGSNDTVTTKLSNLVGVDGDMGSFDTALEKLEKMEKHYQHRRGSGGLIGSVKAEISNLDAEILLLSSKKSECSEVENELSEVSQKLFSAEEKRKECELKRLTAEREKEFIKKRESLLECENEIKKENEFFKGAPPTREEVRMYEKKKNEALALEHTAMSNSHIINDISDDYSDEINHHIIAVEETKIGSNVNKSCYFWFISAILIVLSSVLFGSAVHYLCYLLSLAAAPLVYLGITTFKKTSDLYSEREVTLSQAKIFIFEKSGKNVSDEDVYPALCRMKAELFARKTEKENAMRTLTATKEKISALTEEYETFLRRFSLSGEDSFDELIMRVTSYKALMSLYDKLSTECERYKKEHKIPENPSCNPEKQFTIEDSEAIDSEIKTLRSKKFTVEARLSTLYEELSREDELNEKRLELYDRLQSAKNSHKAILKAAEHLSGAKASLTAKYLGKMRASFNAYTDSIAKEDGSSFAIDTNFSLSKTENGLTNKIEGYSLGTRELYALISRFSLIDALYKDNEPFIILDDPFCHFDDKKCESALKATKKIAEKKQIIYLTCADSRTPS